MVPGLLLCSLELGHIPLMRQPVSAWLIQTDSDEFIPANCKSCYSNNFDKN